MAKLIPSNLDLTFQALAHQTRRDILVRLISEPGTSAGALAQQFDVAQPTVSRHLSQLERAGLVSRHVDGRTHLFFAQSDALSSVASWLNDHRAFWSGSLNRLGLFLDESS